MTKRKISDQARAAAKRHSLRPKQQPRSRWPLESLSGWGQQIVDGPHGAFLALFFPGNPLFLDARRHKEGLAYIVQTPKTPLGSGGWRVASRFLSALLKAELAAERALRRRGRCYLGLDQCQGELPQEALGAVMVGAMSRRVYGPTKDGLTSSSSIKKLRATLRRRDSLELDARRSKRLLKKGASRKEQKEALRKEGFELLVSCAEKALRSAGFGLTRVNWLLEQRAGAIMERGIRSDALAFAQSEALKKELNAALARGAPGFDPSANGARAGRL